MPNVSTAKQILDALQRIEKLTLIQTKPTLNISEAASYLGTTVQAVYKAKANIRHYKAGKHLYFDKTDLDDYMHSTRVMTDHEFELLARQLATII